MNDSTSGVPRGSRTIIELAMVVVASLATLVGLTSRTSGSPRPWYYGGDAPETIFVELGESIQAAIDTALDGWTIDLAYGVHYGQDLDLRGKRIRLRGAIGVDGYGQPYGLSTIQPVGYARVFDIHQGEGPETILEHLVIERGSVFGVVEYGEPIELGGGMRLQSSSPTLRDIVFRNNRANLGGGLALDGASHPTIIDCAFDTNIADHGGGLAVLGTSAPLIERVRIANNAAYGQPIGTGGGLFAESSTNTVVYDGVICGNFPDQIDGPLVEDGDVCVNESCDIDCNGNGVCDAIDIAIGASSDCDGDGVPDECRPTEVESGFYGTRSGFPRYGDTYTYSIPGRANPLPVSLGIVARGDLDSSNEYLTLHIGGWEQRIETPYDCDSREYVYEIPAENWNAAVVGSQIQFSVSSTSYVGYACSNYLRFRVTYPLPDELDTDGDGAADCVDPCPTIPYDCDSDPTTLVLAPGMNIQTAIDERPDTTTIEFVAGTYRIADPIDPRGRPIRFVGAVDAEGRPTTILDGEGRSRILRCISGETDETVFEDLVFVNGSTPDGLYSEALGGAALLVGSSPRFLNCRFSSCRADSYYSPTGGAVFSEGGAPIFGSCIFDENRVLRGYRGRGGAVALAGGSRARFVECQFIENRVISEGLDYEAMGGALSSLDSFPSLDGCLFLYNAAEHDSGILGRGGAIHAEGGEVSLDDCTFDRNTADSGGGIFMAAKGECGFSSDSALTVTNSDFFGNQSLLGGGIHLSKFGTSDYEPDCPANHDLSVRIENSSIVGNTGGGLCLRSPIYDDPNTLQVSVRGGSITDNLGYGDGGGVAVENATLSIDGTTITGNFATYGGGVHVGAASIVELVNDTIQNNTALHGGGILAFLPDRLSIQSTLVCLNAPNQIAGVFEDLGENCIGALCLDSDADGTLDCLDDCPDDPNKIEPGICGCGVTDVDTDGDGTADCLDLCPIDPAKTEPGACGCGIPDTDTDGDGIADCNDPCPEWPYECTDGGSTLVVQPGQSIQLAISVASGGDTIRLAAGRHDTPETIDPLGKAIALAGETDGNGEPITTLDANAGHRVLRCTNGEGAGTVIRDLVITGGDDSLGGGVYLLGASPRLIDCRIVFNNAIIGGGLYCSSGSAPEITGCRIESNMVTDLGGGVFSSSNSLPLFVDSRVCANSPDQIFGPYEQSGESCAESLCDACFNACPADLDGNGEVSGGDLGLLLVAWGPCDSDCPEDLDGDGVVGGSDLGVFLVNIGPCDGD